MKITTTGGGEYYIMENCPYCYPTTGGQHDIKCPNYERPYKGKAECPLCHSIVPKEEIINGQCEVCRLLLEKVKDER